VTIAPVVTTVNVALPPARAFEVFAGQMGRWWIKGKTIGKSPHVDIVVEPRDGGRWFERDAEGVETDWGHVIAWDPPHRLLLGWQLNGKFEYDPGIVTEVELSFVADGTGTRVTLEHRNLERFGELARKTADQLGGGWPTLLQLFADHSQSEETEK
jgi:uncharacterized protein YndB with AHSA1/START domain